MKVQFTSQLGDRAFRPVGPAAAMLGAAMMAALVGCSSNSARPIASSSSSASTPATLSTTSAAASTPTKTRPADQQGEAETIVIGTSGVRCFAGRTTAACVTMDQKGLVVEGKHAFSFVRTDAPGGGVEPGFAPGQHVRTIAVGDLVFLDTSGCAPAGSNEPNVVTANCTALTISSAVTAANSAHIILGVISKASAEGLTVCATDTVFDIPIPPPAEAGAAVFRPGAGQQLSTGQSIRAKNYWSFALKDDTLTISSPGGATTVRV